MPDQTIGTVTAIAVRGASGRPMQEIREVVAVAGGALEGDGEHSPDRGITLISSRQLEQVNRELRADLPWHTRRANVLVDADRLGDLIGRTITIGDVVVAVAGETRPCNRMDGFHPGLKAALTPDCRAGVHGRITTAGTIRVGDVVRTANPSEPRP